MDADRVTSVQAERCLSACLEMSRATFESSGSSPGHGEGSPTNIPIFKIEIEVQKSFTKLGVAELPRVSSLGAQQPIKAVTKLLQA